MDRSYTAKTVFKNLPKTFPEKNFSWKMRDFGKTEMYLMHISLLVLNFTSLRTANAWCVTQHLKSYCFVIFMKFKKINVLLNHIMKVGVKTKHSLSLAGWEDRRKNKTINLISAKKSCNLALEIVSLQHWTL